MVAGRDRELALIHALLHADATGPARALLVEGAPGTGKSTLLAAARQEARARGHRVVSASADRWEQGFAWGVVRQLFDHLAPGAAEDPGAVVPQETLHQLHRLATGLAAERPLLITVDDLQWADLPSLCWLGYLLRRIEGVPVVVIAALRTGERPGLDGPSPRARFPRRLLLGGVDPAAAGELVARFFGEQGEPAFGRAAHAVTGGNPLLLRALLGACRRSGARPDAATARRLGEFGHPEISQVVREQLGSLGPAAVELAGTLAVLGEAVTVLELAAIAAVDADTAADLLHRMAELDLLRREGGTVCFTLPLVAAALAAGIQPSVRNRLHLAAAEFRRDQGAPPDLIAAHLLQAGTRLQPWMTDCLATAAAMSWGAPESACRYLRRLLAEPLPAATRARYLILRGQAQLSLDLPAAITDLRTGLAAGAEPELRAGAAIELSRAFSRTEEHGAALTVLRETAEQLRPRSPELALRLDSERLCLGLHTGNESTAEDLPPDAGEPAVAALLGYRAVLRGGSAGQALRHLRRALREAPEAAPHALLGLVFAGEPEEALRYCDRALAGATSLSAKAFTHAIRAEAQYRLGRLTESEADARACLVLHTQLGLAHRGSHSAIAVGRLAELLIERDRLAEAEELLTAAEVTGPLPDHLYYSWILLARGRLRIAQGATRAGLDDLLACGERLLRRGIPTPAVFPWRARAALARHRLGEQAAAVALAEENLALSLSWDAPEVLGRALRVLGAVRGDALGVDLLRQSTTVLAPGAGQLELARARADLGAALAGREESDEARSVLRNAVDLARHCGAHALARRAKDDLRRTTGSRTDYAGVSALTRAEHRVALLAARGCSNRDIAGQLFVGLRTVEIHLTNTYRKLGLRGRSGLEPLLLPQPEPVT